MAPISGNNDAPSSYYSQQQQRLPSVVVDLLLFSLSVCTSIALTSAAAARRRPHRHRVAGRSAPTEERGGLSGADSSSIVDGDNLLREQLQSGTSRDARERVCTVDENNRPISGGHYRNEMRLHNLWHRATYIIVRHEEEEEEEEGASTTTSKKDGYLLVQRRTKTKDYCPSKLDPAPGGVVGYGESYEENAQREIKEEMGIDVVMLSEQDDSPADSLCGGKRSNTMRKLFAFPYESDRVKCWGGLFEVVYRGSLSAIKIQEEEVDEVLRLSTNEIDEWATNSPDDWMPDGLHALRLYLQNRHDRTLQRRSSSLDLNAYRLRPKPRVIFFDCDDCLYFDGWTVAKRLTAKIDTWCTDKRGLPPGEAYELYKKHGTALRGLLAEGHLEHCDHAIDEYLADVHDVGVDSLLERDGELRRMMERLDPTVPRYVFTASVRHHAERCLEALGIRDLFEEEIIDCRSCGLATKHSREAFEAAMRVAGVTEPESCVFLDDNVKNIRAATEIGWRSVLVGRVGRDCGSRISSDHAEHEIDRIHDFPSVFPELFTGGASRR